MGKALDVAREYLRKSQAEYDDAVVKMADATVSVRKQVLDHYAGNIAEAKTMIETFERSGH